jgi:hypothetical protein
MAKIDHFKFAPSKQEIDQGAVPMDKMTILKYLTVYKEQNPTKYEAKKEALFARYGLNEDEVKPKEPDANDLELAEMAKKLTKKTSKTVSE